MNAKQVQKVLETALLHFQDAVIPEVPARIKAVTAIGERHLAITFTDGTIAHAEIHQGGQS